MDAGGHGATVRRSAHHRSGERGLRLAQSVELAASPISAFLIGPIAEFWLIPYMESSSGRSTWGWLLGSKEARGIALVFLGAGMIMLVTVMLALASAPYRRLSQACADAPPHRLEATGAAD